jgi:molybdate transport system regulatory protein
MASMPPAGTAPPTATAPDLAEVLGRHAGDKRIDILRRIGECGSISEAARRAGVSYKAAWQAIETLSNLAGTLLVDKAVGGSGGGGAVLTPAGLRVLQAAVLLDRARSDVLALLGSASASHHTGPSLAALALRTSMRNQFACTVTRVQASEGRVRVQVQLPGQTTLFARVTRESAQLLQLRRGLPVLALCKATAVMVGQRVEAAQGRNLLQGKVWRASRAHGGGEVVLQLPGPLSLVGFADGGQALRAGQAALAGIDESAVVLALPG